MSQAPDEITQTVLIEIAKLSLKPGDTLVLKVPGQVSRLRADRLHRWVTASLPPQTKCLLLDSGVDLAVLEAKPESEKS